MIDEGLKAYGTNYGGSNLNTAILGDNGIKDWYPSNSLSGKITSSTVFDTSHATFESVGTAGTNAYIYGDVVAKSSIPVYCILTSNGSTVSFQEKYGATSYGLTTSTTATYNSTSSMTIALGSFYGYVKDSSNNTSSCSVTITSTIPGQYKCYTTGSASTESERFEGTSCPSGWNLAQSYSGWVVCQRTVYTCPGNGWHSSPTSQYCYVWVSSSNCPSPYGNPVQDTTCPMGATKLNDSYCMQ